MAQIEQTISICSHVGSDGILHLEVPVEMADTDVVVTVTVRSLPAAREKTSPEKLGWDPGFFEQTFGAWQGEPLSRESQGEISERPSFT